MSPLSNHHGFVFQVLNGTSSEGLLGRVPLNCTVTHRSNPDSVHTFIVDRFLFPCSPHRLGSSDFHPLSPILHASSMSVRIPLVPLKEIEKTWVEWRHKPSPPSLP